MNYLSAENLSKYFNDRWLLKDITFGKSLLLLSLKNSILTTKLSSQQLYEGTAKASLSLNANDPKSPEIGANIVINNIQLLS
ncbi:MAG: hypothetical protein ACKODM_07585, partial [Cytophagales bacterium]